MRKVAFTLLLTCGLLMLSAAAAFAVRADGWPTVREQLAEAHAPAGSALEKLIRANQNFSLLRPDEAYDKIRVPPWLRVVWRRAHPEMEYSPADPTGGYPLVLKEVAEWMESHPDLRPGRPERDVPPHAVKTSGGVNLRISGAQTIPRSESDIRVNYWNTAKIIGASNNIGGSGQQAQFFSSDGGATWGQTSLPLQTGDAFHSDPTVDWTSDGTAWATTIGINSAGTQLRMRAYKSTNGGATWTFDNTFSGTQTNADKQLMWTDHSATSSFANNIYTCWHNGAPQFVNRRTGPAGSWGTPLQISGAETTGTAIGCDVKTNSSGDVFVFWPATGNRRILVAKSTNGGVSYGTPVIVTTTFDSFDIGVPSFNSRRMLIYTTGGAYRTATKNMVYVAWNDLTGATGCTSATNEPGSNVSSTCKTRIKFSRSSDGGATWSAPVMINNQASLNDQFNPAMVVDETNGRIAIIYYDTVNDAGRKKTDIWYQTSTDDGATWSAAFKVTTAQTDETISGADSGNQYGDYNSLSGFAGTFFPSWTDRRGGAREEIWTAAVSETGGGGCTPPAAPTGVTATATGQTTATVSWSAVSGATEYHVLRSTTSGGPYTQVGSVTGTSFNDTGLTCNTSYFYVVRAANSSTCESADSAQASATTSACSGGCTNTTLYSKSFDSDTGLAGWSVGTFVAGGSTTSWRGVQTCTAHTGSNIFRYGGALCTDNYSNSNFNFAQPNGAAGISIPAGSTTTRLSFWHRRAFESGFDGGTLTISVNGTNYFFVPASAILSGTTYNGTTSTSCPPSGAGGRSVFTGISSSFTNTTVNLDAACNVATGGTGGCAGQAVRIGFTSITDCTITDDGWFLDDVAVTACVP
ncbi:MAG TPA: exo-alpha-sialidase [Thermoanaerobaculia bacterium]|nr:exo-alpha-sialidase [Thermoanaerobaculia bacterium]